MAKRHKGTVAEVALRATRAGFRPGGWEENEIELWQVWLRSSDGEKSRRATFDDMRAAGFKPRRTVWG